MQMVSIADKIKKEVNNPDESRFAWTGSRHGDFKLMHKAVQCLKLCESHAAIAPGSYTPILHEWEVRAVACPYTASTCMLPGTGCVTGGLL